MGFHLLTSLFILSSSTNVFFSFSFSPKIANMRLSRRVIQMAVPELSNWEILSSGQVIGNVRKHPSLDDGDTITTSPLESPEKGGPDEIVMTKSGSQYKLVGTGFSEFGLSDDTSASFVSSSSAPPSTGSPSTGFSDYGVVNGAPDPPVDSETREKRITAPVVAGLGALFAGSAAVLNSGQDALVAPVPVADSSNVEAESLRKLKRYFPSAIPITELPAILKSKLPTFTKDNTLLNLSLCSDEANFRFTKTLADSFGSPFSMGGLAGVPFVGVSGLGAAASHIPDTGKILIVIGSHVGYSTSNDMLGKMKRNGKDKLSGACGAAIGALNLIKDGKADSADIGVRDFQEGYIVQQLSARMEGAEKYMNNRNDEMAWLAYENYKIAVERWNKLIENYKFPVDDVAYLGGVVINQGEEGVDLFQPLAFEVFSDGYKASQTFKVDKSNFFSA